MLSNFEPFLLQNNPAIPGDSAQQQGSSIADLLNNLLDWVTSSDAAGISFLINVISFLLAVAGFLLYFQQKREYRLLSGILEEYGLQKRIRKATKSAKSEQLKLDQEINRRRNEIEEAKRDLSERLPAEARKAYYENSIPVIQKQIYDLEKQLESMFEELKACEETPSTVSPHINEILGEEIRKNLSLQRDMEQVRVLLTIFTALTAAVGVLLPYPLNIGIAFILGVVIVRQAYRYWRLYRVCYSRPSKRF